jgi:hypothetical protein
MGTPSGQQSIFIIGDEMKKDKSKILKEVNERIKKNKRIKTACRDICLGRGLDPDRLVCPQMPELLNYPFVRGFYCPDPTFTMPMWRMFEGVVMEALNILEATKC